MKTTSRLKAPRLATRVTKGGLQSIVRHHLLVAARRCKAVPGLPAFKRPPEKIPSGSLFVHLENDIENDDDFPIDIVEEYPWALPSRDLISMSWDGILSSVLSFSALRLDGRTWLYFEHTDSEEDCLYFLALAETDSPRDTHKQFITELFRSNGKTFGAEFLGSPPSHVISGFSRSFLADCFVSAAALSYSDEFWEEVQDVIVRSKPKLLTTSEVDFETRDGMVQSMQRYLAVVLKRR